jgi:CO/xanthine dehydrogenase Mo-binding subunit
MLRSPYHHARLIALDPEAAHQIRGVVRIFTAEDIPGENGLGDYSQNEPILTPVGDTLRMMGAPIALVVADTAENALKGVEALVPRYEELPHAFDMEATLARDAFPIYPKGNVLTNFKLKHGDIDQSFDDSELVLETRYRTSYLEHSALEREATLGYIDSEGRVTVLGTTHEPHWNQGYIAASLALDTEQVRFISPPMGGSFGGKQDPTHAVAVGLAVFHLRQPVSYTLSREESFHASPKRHPYDAHYRIGANKDGRLTGIHLRINANTGGYDAHGQYIPDYAVTGGGGPYRWQAVDAYAQTVYTNGPKSGQYRGFGNSQATFSLECTLDEVAEALKIDPLEFRLMNSIGQKDNSFLGYPVGESLGYAEVLRAVQPHYEAFLIEKEAFNLAAKLNNQPERMGVGLAGMWYRFGKSGSLSIEAHAELAQDGHIVVFCSAPDYGQGTNTVLSQLAAEALDIPRGMIELINGDTALTPDSGIQGASRSTYFVGGAVMEVSQKLKQMIRSVAGEMLDCSPDEVDFKRGSTATSRVNSKEISLQEVAVEFDRMGLSRKTPGFFDISAHYPEETRPEYVPIFCTAAQVALSIVNLSTGVIAIDRVVAAQDVGKVINPADARGQLEGSVVMGLGAALMEEFIPDASRGFGDYYLPTIKSVPKMKLELVEVPSFYGPMGVKGLAEASMPASTPAIVNSISRAIGVRMRQIPVTPERVLAGLKSK